MASKPTEEKETDTLVACTVLVSGTTYGDVICRKGAKIRIPKKEAETLSTLSPPRVEITGV